MRSIEKYYIELIASAAREKCVDARLIKHNDRALTAKKVMDILRAFSLDIESRSVDETRGPYIQNIDGKTTIFCNESDSSLDILHDFGHAFLNRKELSDNISFGCDGTDYSDISASLFARAFLMPRQIFEKVIVQYLNNGDFDVKGVANEYDISCFNVLARCSDLSIGR